MKTNYNGIVFDSDLEVEYYKYLIDLSSKIDLTFIYHPIPITLTRSDRYTPDFIVEYQDRIEIIETKGYNQFSASRDKMIHALMRAKDEEELKIYLLENSIVAGSKKVIYRKIKYLKSFGWVDFEFKNPNTLSNQRKVKIQELEEKLKNISNELKNCKRYITLSSKTNLTAVQKRWMEDFKKELEE